MSMGWQFKDSSEIICDEIDVTYSLIIDTIIKQLANQFEAILEKPITTHEEMDQTFYINGLKFDLYCDWVECSIKTYSSEGEQILKRIQSAINK